MIALSFDTETTGLKRWDNPNFKPALVQLGAILQDLDTDRVLAEINLINSECGDIPVEASNIHGITQEMATRYGIPLKLIDVTFACLLRKADVLVAHNIDYDTDVIEDNMPKSQSVIGDVPQFCTMRSSLYIVKVSLTEKQKDYFTSKGKLPDFPYKVPNLTETFKHFYGKPFEGAHDAMADVRACRDVFLTLLSEGYYEVDEEGRVIPTDKLVELTEAA